MLWENSGELWKKFKIPYEPDLMLDFGNNSLMTMANSESILSFSKKFKFVTSFSLYLNEFVESVTDLVLPDTFFLERLSLTGNFPAVGPTSHFSGLGEWYWAIRHPVINPLYERRNFVEVLFEVIENLGLREKFLRSFYHHAPIRYGGEIEDKHKLDSKEPLSLDKLINSVLKDRFGADHGLEWFKKHGYIKWKKKIEEVYWRWSIDARVPIYVEWFIKYGLKSKHISEKYGVPDLVDWSMHKALPDWHACQSHIEKGEYDLFASYGRTAIHTYSFTKQNPWLNEVAELDPYAYVIQIDPVTAKQKKVKDGDLVWLENPKGRKVKGKIKITEGVKPNQVTILGCAGHWAKGLPIAKGKGVSYNELIEVGKDYTDPLTLNQDLCVKVKLYKA
jgi:molybdopterin-containing oxidoreductase family molybdopterin binding subunit